MKCNEAGLDIIRRFEGLRLKAYYCPAGILTIGYGSTGKHVKEGMTITEEQAEALLRSDVRSAESAVSRGVKVTLNENEFSALVSFVFNVGATQFWKSTMRALINRNDMTGAALQFARWNKAGGQVLAGLTERRKAEAGLFTRPAPKA